MMLSIFSCAIIGHFCIFFGEMSIWSLCPFKNFFGLFVFFLLSCKNFFIFWVQVPNRIHDFQIFFLILWVVFSFSWWFPLEQGSPTPGPWTGTGLRPVWNRATQQEVSSGWASEASPAAPHCSPSLSLPSEPSALLPHLWKNCLPRNWSLVPKKVADHCFRVLGLHLSIFFFCCSCFCCHI